VIPPFYFVSTTVLNQCMETIFEITFSGFAMHEFLSTPSFIVIDELLIEIELLSIRISNSQGFGNKTFQGPLQRRINEITIIPTDL
jgi:hypothetical protein